MNLLLLVLVGKAKLEGDWDVQGTAYPPESQFFEPFASLAPLSAALWQLIAACFIPSFLCLGFVGLCRMVLSEAESAAFTAVKVSSN